VAQGTSPSEELQLVVLGATPQAALRHLVDEFERRGWRDDGGGALAIVRLLQDKGGSATWCSGRGHVPRFGVSLGRME
jgi:hypothetical protein